MPSFPFPFSLPGIDGVLARALGQTSVFGAWVSVWACVVCGRVWCVVCVCVLVSAYSGSLTTERLTTDQCGNVTLSVHYCQFLEHLNDRAWIMLVVWTLLIRPLTYGFTSVWSVTPRRLSPSCPLSLLPSLPHL